MRYAKIFLTQNKIRTVIENWANQLTYHLKKLYVQRNLKIAINPIFTIETKSRMIKERLQKLKK